MIVVGDSSVVGFLCLYIGHVIYMYVITLHRRSCDIVIKSCAGRATESSKIV